MNIEIRLFATLRMGRFKKHVKSYKSASPMTVLDDLAIQKEDVAILLINGRDGDFETTLQEGDVVSIFPPVGGG